MRVFQGNSLSLKQFNFYLSIALKSNPIFEKKIENNTFLAYTDNIVLAYIDKNKL